MRLYSCLERECEVGVLLKTGLLAPSSMVGHTDKNKEKGAQQLVGHDDDVRHAGITAATKPSYIPMSPSFSVAEQDESPPGDKEKYATLLGMLIFLLRTRTCHSIAFCC